MTVTIVAIALFAAPGPRPGVSRAQIHTADQPAYDLAGIVGPVTAMQTQAAAVEAEQVETERVAAEAASARAVESRPPAHYTEPVTTVAPSGDRCQYAEQILAAGLPPAMIGIAWRESNCTADAASPTGCLGLFQTCWPLHADIEQAQCGRSDRDGMFDIACNIAVTVALWDGGRGSHHWDL